MSYQRKTKPALWTTMRDALRPRGNTTVKPSRKFIRHATDGRAKQNREYKRLRKEWLAGKECEGCWPIFNRKQAPATELHHRRGRAGRLLLESRWFCALCDECHRYVHDHPNGARELGLLAKHGEWNTIPKKRPF